MNHYTELMQRQQEEVNALPLGYAFGNKQFAEMMQAWGLHPQRDVKKISRVYSGCYVQKKDLDLLRETLARHHKERAEAIAADRAGNEFIYQMFLKELSDHECGYTGDPTDALDALGYTMEQIQADNRLRRGFDRAFKKIMRRNCV